MFCLDQIALHLEVEHKILSVWSFTESTYHMQRLRASCSNEGLLSSVPDQIHVFLLHT